MVYLNVYPKNRDVFENEVWREFGRFFSIQLKLVRECPVFPYLVDFND